MNKATVLPADRSDSPKAKPAPLEQKEQQQPQPQVVPSRPPKTPSPLLDVSGEAISVDSPQVVAAPLESFNIYDGLDDENDTVEAVEPPEAVQEVELPMSGRPRTPPEEDLEEEEEEDYGEGDEDGEASLEKSMNHQDGGECSPHVDVEKGSSPDPGYVIVKVLYSF